MILIHIICEKIGVCTLKQLVDVNMVPQLTSRLTFCKHSNYNCNTDLQLSNLMNLFHQKHATQKRSVFFKDKSCMDTDLAYHIEAKSTRSMN